MNPCREYELMLTRRQLFGRTATGIGVAALASLLNEQAFAAPAKGLGAVPAQMAAAACTVSTGMVGSLSNVVVFRSTPTCLKTW